MKFFLKQNRKVKLTFFMKQREYKLSDMKFFNFQKSLKYVFISNNHYKKISVK